jgi:uncharacterized membrane protein YdjX (TVP38/TMEM64 family)
MKRFIATLIFGLFKIVKLTIIGAVSLSILLFLWSLMEIIAEANQCSVLHCWLFLLSMLGSIFGAFFILFILVSLYYWADTNRKRPESPAEWNKEI